MVDVYRGEVKAQRSYLRFLLFVSLYHQLVAGPIVRYRHVAAEIDGRTENVRDIEAGIGRFLTGLMKKVLVANAAGKLASGYLSPEAPGLSVLGAWFGIGLFTLQIYYDFSGYSDMAIGLGKMFGFHYQENFIYPYAAASVGDFWRRWHISLGSFFRDYLYIPLGGNRKFWLRNLLITWFATGLWHGASWNFVLWGLYYGVLLAGERLLWGRLLQKLPGALRRLYLMLAVMVGWTLFYFTDLGQAAAYLRCLFGMAGLPLWDIATVITMVNNIFWLTLSVLFCAPLLPALRERLHFDTENRGGGWVLTSALTGLQLAALLICTALLVGNSYNPFLYFRF